jgi:uncharacterized membrane protein
MNLHPLFTHFPVAFLTIYSLFEFVKLKKITDRPYWFYIKACLVIIGTGIGYITFFTGYIQKDDYTAGEILKLINAHFYAAIITLVIFTLLSIAYGLSWLKSEQLTSLNPILVKFETFILSTPVSLIFAFLGLTAITITGALGGALAYGKNVDPFVSFIYNILIK